MFRLKETKADRFCRLAEARVNKIIKMIRLLGNCSKVEIYEYSPEQVEQIFRALYFELNQAHGRYISSPKKKHRFSLSNEEPPVDDALKGPSVAVTLPDGTILKAVAYEKGNHPAINTYLVDLHGSEDEVCFAEFNPGKDYGHQLYIGAYQFQNDNTTYYQPYMAERDSKDE